MAKVSAKYPILTSPGVVKDAPPGALAANPEGFAWTTLHNVRSKAGSLYKTKGYDQIFSSNVYESGGYYASPYNCLLTTDAAGIKYYVYPYRIQTSGTPTYAYGAAVYNGSTHTVVGKVGGYTVTDSIGFNGGVFNNFVIINTGNNYPQYWSPAAPTTKFADLTAWPVNNYCAVIRPYRNWLVALDVTQVATRYPSMVKWSTTADPGTLPSTWDTAMVSEDAGEISLSETVGACIDCLPLEAFNIVYKTQDFWLQRYIGGNDIFSFTKISGTAGILTRNCVVEVKKQHVVFGAEDIFSHDGTKVESILSGKNRRWLYQNLDASNYTKAFAYHNSPESEVWFCFPRMDSTMPDQALVWNYDDDCWSTRDLPECRMMTQVEYDSTGTTFASTDTISSGAYPYDSRVSGRVLKPVVSAFTDSKLYVLDLPNKETDYGAVINATLERKHIPFDNDFNKVKTVHRISFDVVQDYDKQSEFAVWMGYSYDENEPITWEGPKYIDFSKNRHIDCHVTGKFLSIRIESKATSNWRLRGLEFQYRVKGDY